MHRTRRAVMLGGCAAASLLALKSKAFADTPQPAKMLAFENLNTGERLRVTYWEQGAYVPGALKQVNQILRDYRTGDIHSIAPSLLDLLYKLSFDVGASVPFQVISGYRSPRTNAILAEESSGVAAHSLHMEGKAIDIRVPGVELADLNQAAVAMGRGGVGYYPKSDFIHVDVGPVRRWASVLHAKGMPA